MSIHPKKLLFASPLLSNSNTFYTRQYAVADDEHLTTVFFIFTTYLKARSFKVLVVIVSGKLAFKSVAILLALRRKSPLTNLLK